MGRGTLREDELIRDFDHLWSSADGDDYGTLSRRSLQIIIGAPRWGLRRQMRSGGGLTLDVFRAYLSRGPCILGYAEPAVGNHVVVAFEVHDGPPRISVMDPNGAVFRDIALQVLQQSNQVIVGYLP